MLEGFLFFIIKDHVTCTYTECGISQLTFHAENECKNEAKAQIVTC
jgi:hypothetical protein